ncbi:MAG: Asp23/Gls24 family envelope stress response protein [Dehalococcoidia bacterium]
MVTQGNDEINVSGSHSVSGQELANLIGRAAGAVAGVARVGKDIEIYGGDGQASVAIELTIEHGRFIPEVVRQVREAVSERLEQDAGITAAGIKITVSEIVFPEGARLPATEETPATQESPESI